MCIYVYNLTRKPQVAFISQLKFFGGSLIALVPKHNINNNILERVSSYINSYDFRSEFMFSGRFKIGQRQLCECVINKNILI